MKRFNVRRAVLAVLWCCYAFLWFGGLAQSWRSVGGAANRWLGALFLTLAVALVLLSVRTHGERLALLIVASLGFAVEVVGVHFGVPFGKYNYSDALGPRILGVPPAVAFAWTTLAAYVKHSVARLRFTPLAEVFVASFWLTAIDLLVDPLAANQLGYWHWEIAGVYYGIPQTNFIGWFLFSLLVFAILRRKYECTTAVRLVGISIILFFTLLAVAFNVKGIAMVGCALLLIEGVTSFYFRDNVRAVQAVHHAKH